jgi:hypothetical protein
MIRATSFPNAASVALFGQQRAKVPVEMATTCYKMETNLLIGGWRIALICTGAEHLFKSFPETSFIINLNSSAIGDSPRRKAQEEGQNNTGKNLHSDSFMDQIIFA